ncbi:hypothetical protein BC938DRAFT_483226, partial [Jimgerdemannia flammicorona]
MEVDEGDEEEEEGEEKEDETAASENFQVYLPGQPLATDEVLEADQTAYEMLHSLNVQWPCLSFDVLWDQLGEERKT